MRVSYRWIGQYVELDRTAAEIADLLTMIGLEVDEVVSLGEGLEGILAARILKVRPHPRADRLSLCEITAGEGSLEVVCGAENLLEGLLVPYAPPGTRLPGGTEVGEATIKGERSRGMLLAEDELGLTTDHRGLMVLPEAARPGMPLPEILPVRDWVLDVSITPNRADCTSVLGIAREIAAATGKPLMRPSFRLDDSGPPAASLASVEILDPKGCPRYAAGVLRGILPGVSPFWLRYVLHLSGMRSINTIVDVTNFVMLELGQPLHAFDYHRLAGNRICVRRAEPGERFTTLDGVEHTLDEEHLMICDGQRPVALAGIMGGRNSEIEDTTRDVLLESATFEPRTIRRGAKRLGLSTEASYRFERGTDIEGVAFALRRAMALMTELSGGTPAVGIVDAYPGVFTRPGLPLRVERCNRFLGVRIGAAEMAACLRALEMEVACEGEDRLTVVPPSFRVDISREVDLFEEIARLTGYDRIPVTYPRISIAAGGPSPMARLRDRTRALLAGFGFQEVITYSFIAPEALDRLGAKEGTEARALLPLRNPLTMDQSVMRTSLLPGLLHTVLNNSLYEERDLRLFEWGKLFFAEKGRDLPREGQHLAALVTGLAREKAWYGEERPADIYDLKGVLEGLLTGLGISGLAWEGSPDLPWYDPTCATYLLAGGVRLGTLGRVSRPVCEAFGLKRNDITLFELDGQSLETATARRRAYLPLPKYPAVTRDISFVLRRDIPADTVTGIIRTQGGDLVESVKVFDLYSGKGMDPGEKAVGYRISYRSRERTLEGEEVNGRHEAVIARIVQDTGGKLREG